MSKDFALLIGTKGKIYGGAQDIGTWGRVFTQVVTTIFRHILNLFSPLRRVIDLSPATRKVTRK